MSAAASFQRAVPQRISHRLGCGFHELSVAEGWGAVEAAVGHLVREVKAESYRRLWTADKRSRVLQVSHALKKLTRSKTAQW
ncbi:hypothetical protein SKAU_G00245710 [Synaphobranchus kaupii]|uniref:Uncharacterized protein n=1 Tax=Synaphobranchus kaupii TaxID=118154 RepID=A0A9Q1F1W6_SYNKA|nr:hypothetical protein SKAU_G00245710 [Synaphobranchus kaupii]